MNKTFTLTHEQYCVLMSALQHAIDVYQDTRQPRTEAEATTVQAELRRQANAQYDAQQAEPEACPHCHSKARYFEHLEGNTWECFDCGETFEVTR